MKLSQKNESSEKEDFIKAFIGKKKKEKYLNYFKNFEEKGFKITWNWPAFFLTGPWLMYRKMWLETFVFLITPLTLTAITVFIRHTSGVESASLFAVLAILIIFFTPALVANYIYFLKSKAKVKEAKNIFTKKEEQLEYLNKSGGTLSAKIMVFVAIPIFIILTYFFHFLASAVALSTL